MFCFSDLGESQYDMKGATAVKLPGQSDPVPRLAIALLLLFPLAASPQQTLARRSAGPAANQAGVGQSIADLRQLFQNPPEDCRVMVRWWWFGPAVAKPELEREMRLMREGGIGGFEVQPVYPVALDDVAAGIRTLPFLSDEFIEALRFTSEKARDLGLRMDLTLGSGWPYGGPQVPISLAAGKLRYERVPVIEGSRRVPAPDIPAGEKLIAVFLARSQGQSLDAGSLREITDIRDGAVQIPSGIDGPHELLFFISSRTGMMVKRPAVGAEGFVLDHYDRAAIDNYLGKVGDRLMQALGHNPPYAIFCDSLEVYESDWTGDFLVEFQKRHGYDLKPHLLALVFDLGLKTAAVRHDWGQTLTDLLNERFLVPLHEWSRRNRTRFRLQGYGVPPATLSSNANADLPEGEGAQWKALCASRWASSASHLYGHPVTSSETWTWLHSPSFRATPLDMKAEADLHFLQGINQLIGHGWPYTAEGVEYPGWRFYAAGVFNEKNPWWIVMPDLSLYLQRLSYLLRQGHPVNDVALYLPDSDAWASFSARRVNLIDSLRARIGPDIVAQVLDAGFNFDFFDDQALRQIGRVENGALELGTNRYKAVILPNVERIPLDTLQKLEDLARGGGTVIAVRRLPAIAPGFMATEAEQGRIREISRRMFEAPSARAHFVDEDRRLGGALAALLHPDVTLSPAATGIGFVHRSAGAAEIYFLANTANTRQSLKATFRGQGMQAEWWDPLTGRVSVAEAEAGRGGGMTVQVDLEPYGSSVLVFSKRPPAPKPIRSAAAVPPLIDLSTGWQVSFGANSKAIRMDRLRSWTEDEETRYFSGLATYEKEVVAPESMLQNGLAVRLDFGEGMQVPATPSRGAGMQAWIEPPVREAAIIYINDRRAGSVWCPPYSLDVTGLLQPGENKIRIVVANVAINHMAGRRLPDYRLLNLRYGVRFEPQDMDKVLPVPSGLLGSIRLIPARP
jgi:hypothetical protein